jgi:hypothetical protein
MARRSCRFNDQRLKNARNEMSYEAVMIDLALTGVLDRDHVAKLLGYEIPSYLTPPAGFKVVPTETAKGEVDDE